MRGPWRIAWVWAVPVVLLAACGYEGAPDQTPASTVEMATVENGWYGEQSFLFVIHRKHDLVSRVDTETQEVTHIGVGSRPFTMAVTPDGKTVVVVNRGDMTVSIIDTLTATVRTAPSGADPRDVAVSGDGRWAAVANYENNSFTLIDLETRDAESFLCPDGPTSVAFSADGSRLFATSYWQAGLCIFNMEEREGEEVLVLNDEGYQYEFGAQDVVAGPAGSDVEDRVFVAVRENDNYWDESDSSEVVAVDYDRRVIVDRKVLGPAPASLAIRRDGKRLYALGKDLFGGPNWVAEFEVEEGGELTERFRYNIDRDPTSLAIHPTRELVYVACRKKDKVKVLDTDLKFDSTIPTWNRPYTLGLNPSGTRLFVAHDDDVRGRLSIIDTQTNQVLKILKLL